MSRQRRRRSEFHDNPNYVTVFALRHMHMALQSHEVETSSPPLKKRKTSRKTQPTLPSSCVTGHAQFRIRLQITRFYFPYMETNRRLIWIVIALGRQCKFHVPSPPLAAHKLLAHNIAGYRPANIQKRQFHACTRTTFFCKGSN